MQRRIALGRTQVGHQQLLAAKHVQRQEAVVVVVTAEVPPLLLAIHRVVGGVEVQDQLVRRSGKRRDELLDQDAVQFDRRRTIGARLEPAQRRARRRTLFRLIA